MPRKQGVEVLGRMLGDAGQLVDEPDPRIDIVHLGRDDQAVHDRHPLPPRSDPQNSHD